MREGSTLRQRMSAIAAVLVIGAAGSAAIVGTAHATTQPSPYTVIRVFLTDKGITLSKDRATGVTYVLFYVVNKGKLPHNLVIGAQHTKILLSGQRAQLPVAFPDPGVYILKDTVHAKSRSTAKLKVTFPVRPD